MFFLVFIAVVKQEQKTSRQEDNLYLIKTNSFEETKLTDKNKKLPASLDMLARRH